MFLYRLGFCNCYVVSGCCFLFDRCNVVVNILENAHKVAATETTCDDCQSAIVEVQFKVIGSFVTLFHFSLALLSLIVISETNQMF